VQLREHEEGGHAGQPGKGETLRPTSATGGLGEGKEMAEHAPPSAQAVVVSPPGSAGVSNETPYV